MLHRRVILPQVSQLIERGMQQPISAEIRSLLSAASVKVAFSSVLKEMAVDCDLTDLEEVLLLGKSVSSLVKLIRF